MTTVTVAWERETPGRGVVRYGLTTNYTNWACDPGGYRHHAITLRDLLPGTEYHYKVLSTDGFEAEDRTFRTAPGPQGNVNLVVHGDLQGGLDTNWARSVAARIAADDPDMVISIGDISDEVGTLGFSTWAQFFSVTTDELERAVFMPVPGNHDRAWDPLAYYWSIFDLPERPSNERYYSFTSANIHFIALNSEDSVYAPTNWLARDLQAAAFDTNVAWIIAYFHRPPYTKGSHSPEVSIKTNWCSLFVRYEADFVFNGHNHGYERTIPIRGITYIVTGGAGGSLYSVTYDPSFHAYATTCYHHVYMQVTGSVMQYRSTRSDGLLLEDPVFTNQGRFVRVSPIFPRRGDTATIIYNASNGPLAAASPVRIHLGIDDFGSALVDADMTWNAASGRWEYDYVVPTSAFHRLAFVFHDGGGTWDNNYDYNWQALLDRAVFIPVIPTAGASVTVRYEADMGPLAGSGQVYAHVGYETWRRTAPADIAMTNVSGDLWEYTLPVPDYAHRVDVCFHDGTTWDNNSGHDWHADVAGPWAPPPFRALPLLAQGTPVLATNPPGQNAVGDNFDFSLAGTSLTAQDADAGFGDFGHLYFNYDASNLYVGGIDADLGGTNNVFVLFLGLDTLTDDAWDLSHKSGLPNTLGYMHNVSFTEPMDIAIVFGDEYGDDADYTNFSYGGYDFGQGIYYLSTNSSSFAVIPGARLSQFDGTGTTACVSSDDDGNRPTDRWEASLPWWPHLNASNGIDSVNHILVAGVIGSDSVTDSNRYLSATYVGDGAAGTKDGNGQFAKNALRVTPTLLLVPRGDYDGDGLPNLWEHEHFGSAEGPAAGDDNDSDGFNNWGEYIAGSQPTNAGSFFFANSERGASGGFVLDWPWMSGRVYAVCRSEGTLTNFTPLATDLYVSSYTDTVSSATAAFYRIEVKP